MSALTIKTRDGDVVRVWKAVSPGAAVVLTVHETGSTNTSWAVLTSDEAKVLRDELTDIIRSYEAAR